MTPYDDEDEHSTILQHRFAVTEAPEGEFVIEVASGPDAGLTMVVDGSESAVIVGKGPAATLRSTDARVSRRHLSLEMEGRTLRVRDLESTNGTFMNGTRVFDVAVREAATLSVGDTVLHITWRPRGGSKAQISYRDRFGGLVGASREMRRLYPLCEKLALSTVPVIIEGETGTGKEALAEALHETGPRSGGPFVVFDCTATPSNLVEAELVGFERGAFTGATQQHRGVFEQADGGTLLIDEIGDMPLAEQAKLLRVIERREFRRLGGERTLSVDVRIIVATRRDLDHEIEAGRFRDDLFHRLAVARVELPPLRRRHGDVSILAEHLWRELGGSGALPSEVVARWERHHWPGNVRELRNAVARFVALGDAEPHERREPAARAPKDDFAATVADVLARGLPLAVARQLVIDEFERRYLEHALNRHGGVVTAAAAAAGVARRHFHRLLSRTRG
jgi:DNA-binding NtrC family response regulator